MKSSQLILPSSSMKPCACVEKKVSTKSEPSRPYVEKTRARSAATELMPSRVSNQLNFFFAGPNRSLHSTVADRRAIVCSRSEHLSAILAI